MREIFDELSRELKALDPCISEEFLKYYVAYKAETNFVDVVPQAKRLLLSLNLGFHELHDPHGIARDVTDIGTWGNGDIDVGLASSEDIPYVLGLVRQALEKQMGDLQD
jgi:predicted transport protein